MKTWDDIEQLIGHFPKSQWHRIAGPSGDYDTINIEIKNNFPKETDDTEILDWMHRAINQEINKPGQETRKIYVRVYPEIVLLNGEFKRSFCRLQLV